MHRTRRLSPLARTLALALAARLAAAALAPPALMQGRDTDPPITEAELDPPWPDGLADWYVGDVAVRLVASDGPGGSGVAVTHYRVDGGYAKKPALTTHRSATLQSPLCLLNNRSHFRKSSQSKSGSLARSSPTPYRCAAG